jgi:hypothetical protein
LQARFAFALVAVSGGAVAAVGGRGEDGRDLATEVVDLGTGSPDAKKTYPAVPASFLAVMAVKVDDRFCCNNIHQSIPA